MLNECVQRNTKGEPLVCKKLEVYRTAKIVTAKKNEKCMRAGKEEKSEKPTRGGKIPLGQRRGQQGRWDCGAGRASEKKLGERAKFQSRGAKCMISKKT